MPTVIVDLSYLKASRGDAVRSALHGYTVLISFELIYEMKTNSRGDDPRMYLDKLVGLELVHSRSLSALANEEERTSHRVENVLHPQSKQLVDVFVNRQRISIAPDVEQELRDFYEKDEPQRLRDGLDGMWDAKHDDIFAITRQTGKPSQIATEAQQYLELYEALGVTGIGKVIAEKRGMTQPPAPGWLTYEWERLRNFLAFRFRLNGARSHDLSDKTLANDLADLTYLAFLPHVQAIATQDTTLIVPLAQAFGSANLTIIQPRQ